jgi:hypothetical protein
VHDAVGKAPNLEHIVVELAAVSLVRENALAGFRVDLIQDGDKFLRVRPVCRRGMAAEDKAVPTVRGGVDFVSVKRSVAFAPPSRLGIIGIADRYIRPVLVVWKLNSAR